MIHNILVENFRSIKRADLNLNDNIKAFVGENSAGKSAIIDAILIFFQYGNNKLTPEDLHFGEENLSIKLVFTIEDHNIDKLFRLFQSPNNQFFTKVSNSYNNKFPNNEGINTKKFKDFFKSMFKSNFLGSPNVRHLHIVLNYQKKDNGEYITKYCLEHDAFKDSDIVDKDVYVNLILKAFTPTIAFIGEERNFEEEKKGEENSITNGLLRILLNTIKDKNLILDKVDESMIGNNRNLTIDYLNKLILEQIKKMSTDLKNATEFYFEKNLGSKQLKIDWSFDNNLYNSITQITSFKSLNDHNIDFQSVGAGTRSIYILSLLQSYVDLINERSKYINDVLFLIEEPELYLHPKLQFKMANTLNKIAHNSQVLFTTHSTNILSSLPLKNVFFFEKRVFKNGNNRTSIQVAKNMNDIYLKIGYDIQPFLGKKYVIIVEGDADKYEYSKIVQKFYSDYFDSTIFLPVHGVANIKFILNLQFLSMTNLKNKILIIRDSDSNSPEKAHEKQINTLHQLSEIKELYSKDELKKMIYTTEASLLETLKFQVCKKDDDSKEKFLNEYKEFIYSNKNEKNDLGGYLRRVSKKDGENSILNYPFFRYKIHGNLAKNAASAFEVFLKEKGFEISPDFDYLETYEEFERVLPRLSQKLNHLYNTNINKKK